MQSEAQQNVHTGVRKEGAASEGGREGGRERGREREREAAQEDPSGSVPR